MSDDFDDTIWSLIDPHEPPNEDDQRRRMDRIVSLYYRPMRAYLRRILSEHFTDDVLHDFILHHLRKKFFERKWAPNSRFRNYLKVSLRNFAYDEIRKRNRHRGQNLQTPEVDSELERRSREAAGSFDASWSQGLLKKVIEEYREHCHAASTKELLDSQPADRQIEWRIFVIRFLRPAITRQAAPTYAEVAGECGLSEGAVSNRIRSLREAFTAILQRHLRQYIDVGESLDDVKAQVCGLLAVTPGSSIELPTENRSVEVTGRDLSVMLASISDSDAGEGVQSAGHLLELTVAAYADEADGASIPDEWKHQVLQTVFDIRAETPPPLDLLQQLKDVSRQRATHARPAYAVIYHACLAAGWVMHQTNLSSLPIAKQRKAFRQHLTSVALPVEPADLFLEALAATEAIEKGD